MSITHKLVIYMHVQEYTEFSKLDVICQPQGPRIRLEGLAVSLEQRNDGATSNVLAAHEIINARALKIAA